ncbi:MAG: efflux transporter outer membrane subunit [Nevskia sp.]|nr:efflux transporter outer membrane subunit [Nevskia sp.]
MKRPALGVAAALLLAACIPPPKDAPRLAQLPAGALGLGAAAAPAVDDGWWKSYGDPQLDRLADEALAHNPSLEQALARVRAAQSQAEVEHARLLPGFYLDADEARQRFSANSYIPPPFAGGTYWQGQVAASMTWHLDFWGRQAALLGRARAQTSAAGLDVASARLALAGALAQAYIDLDRNYALADLAQRTEAQRSRILELTRGRLSAGLDTRVELRQAEGSVPQARVELQQAQAAQALAVHQLAALAGRGADAYAGIQRPRLQLDTALPLPAALPADLLGRRPDVLAARLRVEAATAGRQAAKAEFYPDVNLTVLAGYSAIGLHDLFDSSSRTWDVGPAVHLPIFMSARLKAQFRGATAELDEAIAAYNDTVLHAVRQAADQLSLIAALQRELAEQQRSLDAAEDAWRIAQERYGAGLSSYLSVLSAETQVLTARRQRVELVSAQAAARVALLLTVGGSFDPQAPLPLQAASNPHS